MKRKMRIPPLLLGADLIFMGIAEIIMSSWTKPAGTTMLLLGIACARSEEHTSELQSQR